MIPPSETTLPVREQSSAVASWMSKRVFTTKPDACLLDAFEIMRDHRVRHVPVLEGDKLVGILSDRDMRSALPSRRSLEEGWSSLGASLLSVGVAQVMTVMPVTIASTASIREAAQTMCRHKIGALPVVDDGHLVGILSAEDLLWAMSDAHA